MSKEKVYLHDHEIAILLDLICHGRPFSPQEVWLWMEEDDIESLRHGDITVFNVMPALDTLQESGRKPEPSNTHNIPMPKPEYPPPEDKAAKIAFTEENYSEWVDIDDAPR